MRALLASVVVHLIVGVLAFRQRPAAPPRAESPTTIELIDLPPVPVPLPAPVRAPAAVAAPAAVPAPAPAPAAGGWADVVVHVDDGTGTGTGNGNGNGSGNGNGNGSGHGGGIGFGDGGGIAAIEPPPPVPAPPPASKARAAKLLQPSREMDVIDDSYLFVARVTVDPEGDVVAVRMVTTRPGARGEQAASAIWQFRYAPALDDDGQPIRSTFEQPFQIR